MVHVTEVCESAGATCPSTSAAPSTGVPSGATTYSYDKAGNQLTGGLTATWDAKSRIDGYNGIYSSILSPTNNEIVGLGSGNTFTNSVLGVQRIEMGGNLFKLVRNPDNAAVLAQVTSTAKHWYVQDHLGSTIALVDGAGTVARTFSYDADGNSTASSGGPDTWIKYAGGHDIGGGLYHYGARFYQPSSGRWTQQDPLLQPGDLRQSNRYVYAASDPVNFTDPTGQIVPAIVAVGAFGARVAAGYAARRVASSAAGRAAAGAGRWALRNKNEIAGVGISCGWAGSYAARKGTDLEGAALTAAGCASAGVGVAKVLK